MKIAISGANGYIGKHLTKHIKLCGHEAVELSSKSEDPNTLYSFYNCNLPNLQGCDALIILSYDKSASNLSNSININADGVSRIVNHAKSSGINIILYISSLSSYQNCKSIYGKTKFAIEKICIEKGVKILRPGLVFSLDEAGGTFAGLVKLASLLPIIPIFSGKSLQYLIHIDDLCKDILTLLNEENYAKVYFSCYSQPIEFAQLIKNVSKFKKLVLISLPFIFIYYPYLFVSKLGLKVGPGPDSLIGLKYYFKGEVRPINVNHEFDYKKFIS